MTDAGRVASIWEFWIQCRRSLRGAGREGGVKGRSSLCTPAHTGGFSKTQADCLGGTEKEWLAGKLGKGSEQLCYYRWVLMKEHVFTRQKRKNGIKSRKKMIYTKAWE